MGPEVEVDRMTLNQEIDNLRYVLSLFDPFALFAMGLCAGVIISFLIALITFPWTNA
jgi:hypothetical protein